MIKLKRPQIAEFVRLAGIAVILFTAFAFFLVFVDLEGARLVSRYPFFTFIYSHRGLTYIAFAIVVGAACKPLLAARASRTASTVGWILYLVFLALLFDVYRTPGDPQQVFLEHLYTIRIGDTTTVVQSKMANYGDATASGIVHRRDPAPTYTGFIVYQHGPEREYGDVGVVHFVNGRVVSIEFSPD